MKNKIFSKMMMIALIVSSMFLISACSVQKDVGVSSISIIGETNFFEIYEGEFDEANIRANVVYEDGSTETITITENMVTNDESTWVNTPGTYAITILFKGKTLDITVKVLPKYITVKFYDGYGNVVSTQSIKKGTDAVAPESGYEIDGMEFIGWDRLFTNLTEDTAVYACYGNITALDIESTLLDWQYRTTIDGNGNTIYEFYKFADEQVYYYNGKLNSFLYSEKDSVQGVDYKAVYTSFVTDSGVKGTWTISFEIDDVSYSVIYNGKALCYQTDLATVYYEQLCTKYALAYNTWYTWTISESETDESSVNGYIRIISFSQIEYYKGSSTPNDEASTTLLNYSLFVNEEGIISIVTEETSLSQSLKIVCPETPYISDLDQYLTMVE